MRALEWFRDSTKHPVAQVYVVHGDDLYLKREAISAIVRVVLGEEADEFALRRFEGNAAGLADVMDELRTLPFFARRRLVVVDDADPFVTRTRKELEAYVKSPTTGGVLVLVV